MRSPPSRSTSTSRDGTPVAAWSCVCVCVSTPIVLKILIYEGVGWATSRIGPLGVLALAAVGVILAVSAWFALNSIPPRPQGKKVSEGAFGMPHPLGDDQVRAPGP